MFKLFFRLVFILETYLSFIKTNKENRMNLEINQQTEFFNLAKFKQSKNSANSLEAKMEELQAKHIESEKLQGQLIKKAVEDAKNLKTTEYKNEAFLDLKTAPKNTVLNVIKEVLNLRGAGDNFKNFENYKTKDTGKYSYIYVGNKAENELTQDDVVIINKTGFRPIVDWEYIEPPEKDSSEFNQRFADLKEYELRSLEDFDQRKPIKEFSFIKKGNLDKSKNSINLVPNTELKASDEAIFYWTKNSVEFRGDKKMPYIQRHQEEYKAEALHHFTRIANKEMVGIYFDKWDSQKVKEALQSMGIDTSKDFFVNGKKFWINEKTGQINWQAEVIKRKDHANSKPDV